MAVKQSIKEILQAEAIGQTVTIAGWVRTFRNNQFIALSDGSTIKTLQVVVDFDSIGRKGAQAYHHWRGDYGDR